jgi:hypothetical protein
LMYRDQKKTQKAFKSTAPEVVIEIFLSLPLVRINKSTQILNDHR